MSKYCTTRDFTERVSYWSEIVDKPADNSDNLVVNGSWCSIKVENDAMVVQPGELCEQSREPSVFYRGRVPFDRLVILSRHGNISIDVLHWLRDQRISLLVLDWKGDIVLSSYPEPSSNPVLRRLQYTLSYEKCIRIACTIIRRKTMAQLEVVKKHPELKDHDKLLDLLQCGIIELENPDYRFQNTEYLRMYEARLAGPYFQSFEGLPIKWYKSDEKIVPNHWRVITGRKGISTYGNAKKAINPFHTALNYIYGVVEHQLLRYILAVGLDPACGVYHNDKIGRDSLLWDLIEPHRATVDDTVLKFFHTTTFRKGDVRVYPSGQIELNTELARYLVSSYKVESRQLQSTVQWFKSQLLE